MQRTALFGADRAGSAVVAFGGGRLLVSRDGGARWRMLPRPRKQTIRDASFVSPTVGFVLDLRGRAWRTRDGGRHRTELLGVGTRRA